MRFRTLTAQREAGCRGQAGQPGNCSRSDTWPYSNAMAHCDLNGEALCCEQSPAGIPNRARKNPLDLGHRSPTEGVELAGAREEKDGG